MYELKNIEKYEGFFIIITVIIAAVYQGLYFPIQYFLSNLILSILALYLYIQNRGVEFNKKPLFFLCSFTLIYFISALLSSNKTIAFEELLRILGFIPALVIGIYMNRLLFNNLLKAILISSIIVAVIGLCNISGIISIEGGNYNGRLQSTFLYANTTALFFLIGIIISLKIFINKGYIFYISIFILFLSLILTYSRSVWIIFGMVSIYILLNKVLLTMREKYKYINTFLCAAVMAFYGNSVDGIYYILLIVIGMGIIYLIYKMSNQQYILSLAVIIPILIYLNRNGLPERLLSININASEFNARKAYYKGAVKVISENPLLGCGVRGWEIICKDIVGIYSKFVHNYYLQIACDAGILALISFLGFIYSVISQYKTRLISLLIVVIILVHSLVDVSMHFQLISYILFLTSGKLTVKPTY